MFMSGRLKNTCCKITKFWLVYKKRIHHIRYYKNITILILINQTIIYNIISTSIIYFLIDKLS